MADGQHAPAQRLGAESMVKKHFEKVQAEKEEAGINNLQSSLPKICRPVLALALEDCKLDADRALMLLRQFQSDKFEQLAALRKKRRRVESSLQAAESDSESDERRGKKHKKRKKESDKKKSKSKSSSKHKKHKKHRHSRHSGRDDSGDSDEGGGRQLEFGSYGIIRESDYALKRQEFVAWASEVKHIDVEFLPRSDERELFASYMEDYNTCTLPHKKYYDLEAYTRRSRASPSLPTMGGDYQPDFVDDERLRRAELVAQRRKEQDASARETLAKMLLSKEHLSELKDREMIQLQAQEAYKRGDMDKAAQLMKKLQPEDPDDKGPQEMTYD